MGGPLAAVRSSSPPVRTITQARPPGDLFSDDGGERDHPLMYTPGAGRRGPPAPQTTGAPSRATVGPVHFGRRLSARLLRPDGTLEPGVVSWGMRIVGGLMLFSGVAQLGDGAAAVL